MGLKHIKLPEAQVKFPGGDFAVRGLSLDDLAFIVQRHGAKLNSLFTDFIKKGGDLTVEAVADFALPLLQACPEIAAELIACASGDPEDSGVAATLPFPVQLEALEKLAELTFNVSGGPKKLVETVLRMAKGTTGLLDSLKA
jgi:hypothetical protein